MTNEQDIAHLSARIEDLVQRIESIAEPAVRANVLALLQSLIDLHCQGLGRIATILSQEGEIGQRIFENIAADDLVGGLLLLYDLHPDSVETRVGRAVEQAQQQLHGGSVELIGFDEGVVRLRLKINESGCATTHEAVHKEIEDCIYSAAPEVQSVQIERVAPSGIQSSGLVQLQMNAAGHAG